MANKKVCITCKKELAIDESVLCNVCLFKPSSVSFSELLGDK
jgi:hypothetical protein